MDDCRGNHSKVRVTQLVLYLAIFVAMPMLTFLVGRSVDGYLGLPVFPPLPWNLVVGLGVFLGGLWLGLRSTMLLYGLGGGLPWGEVKEEAKTSRLVTSGVYAYTRNPMILGYTLLPFGMGVMFQSPGMALTISPFVLVANVLIVKLVEEPNLVARFGEDYIRYRERTPILIPKLRTLYSSTLNSVKGREVQLLYLFISLVGLIILTRLAFSKSAQEILSWQTHLVGAIFTTICLFGFVVAVFPRSLRGISHGSVSNPHWKGHHPNCERFSNHLIWIKERPYCAGCTGLALGAALSIIGSVLYFVLGVFPLDTEAVFWLGVCVVALGLAQHFVDLGSPHLHLVLNVGLVYGSFLLAASLNVMGASLYVEAYHLGLVVLWVASRISLSQEEHTRICRSCGLGCGYGYSLS
jgi:protein-S-isoprenylcysteine O-methyltransferase Ste14